MGFVRVIVQPKLPPWQTFGHQRNGRMSPCVMSAWKWERHNTQLNEKRNNINISSHNKLPKEPLFNTKHFYDQPYIFLLHRISAVVFNLMYAHVALYNLTLNLLTTTIVAPPSNASKWQMGFNSAFKGLILWYLSIFQKVLCNQCFKWYVQMFYQTSRSLWPVLQNLHQGLRSKCKYVICVPNIMSCSILHVTL